MKIVILGSGRVGARLARLMEAEGHEVSIIDADVISFKRLPEDFRGETVLGTGIDVDVLKAAGIEHADAFAAVTNFDNTNIMACQVAKEIFGVPRVLARIYDPGREDLYHELGLETICPTTLISTTARDILLAPDGVEVIQMPPHTDNYSSGPIIPATTPATPSQAASPARPAQPSQPQQAPAPAPQPVPASIPAQDQQAAASQARPGQPPQPAQASPPAQSAATTGHPEPNGRGLRALFKH